MVSSICFEEEEVAVEPENFLQLLVVKAAELTLQVHQTPYTIECD